VKQRNEKVTDSQLFWLISEYNNNITPGFLYPLIAITLGHGKIDERVN
jgi:hypothetical protein